MTVTKKSLKNLKPYKKGEKRTVDSAKKSKRPPTFKNLINDIFEQNKKKKGKLTLENYMQAVLVQAIKGNSTALKEINDRYFGKVKEEIKIESDVSGTLSFQDIAAKKK